MLGLTTNLQHPLNPPSLSPKDASSHEVASATLGDPREPARSGFPAPPSSRGAGDAHGGRRTGGTRRSL